MSNIGRIAEAMNRELTGGPVRPEVVLRTFARMGYRAHKYPAADTTCGGDPHWSLDAGLLTLTRGAPDNMPVLTLGDDALGTYGTTLDEYQQLAEGILAAVELARDLQADEG